MSVSEAIFATFSRFDWVSHRTLPTVLLETVTAGDYISHPSTATLVLVQTAAHEGKTPYDFCMERYGDDHQRLIRLGLHRFRRGFVYYDRNGIRVGDNWTITNYQGHNNMPVTTPYYGWFPQRPETIAQTRDVKPTRDFSWT